LRYPNPTDPLNGEAAALQIREPAKYDEKVAELVKLHASSEAVLAGESGSRAAAVSDDEASDLEAEVEHEEMFPDDMDDF
jgi:ubiquitin-conjugating enzyme E2 H